MPALIRFFLRRLALGIITLFLLSITVFAIAHLLPGDVGRAVLGPFSDQQSVDLLNHKLGVDRPILTQYFDWISGFARGDMGDSLQYQAPVWSLLEPSLVNSLKLAAVAFLLVVPAGYPRWRRSRRCATDAPSTAIITVGGLSLTAIPEFVSAIALIIVFGVLLRWFPVTAAFPAGPRR